MTAEEYLKMLNETSELISKEKRKSLANAVLAYHETVPISNEIEFWNWLGQNYPKDLSSTELIRRSALDKSRACW